MKQLCIQCKTENSQNARFCEACGFSLGATITQGRTVVAPPVAPFEISEDQAKTAIRDIEKSIGTNNMAFSTGETNMSRAGQRECVVIIIDRSGSMGERFDSKMTKLDVTKRAILALVLDKDPQDEIALVIFNSHAQQVLELCPIHSHKQQIIKAIQSLTPNNGTVINEGLVVTDSILAKNPNGAVQRAILLTDGHGGNPLQTAQAMKSRGVIIDVVGVGPKPDAVNETLLKKVASVINGQVRYRFIKDSNTLVRTFTALAAKTSTY